MMGSVTLVNTVGTGRPPELRERAIHDDTETGEKDKWDTLNI
jgi:hypothetical protein